MEETDYRITPLTPLYVLRVARQRDIRSGREINLTFLRYTSSKVAEAIMDYTVIG